MAGAGKRPTNLDTAAAAKAEVEEMLHCTPRRYGIDRSRWRLQDIRQVIPWLRSCTIAGVSQILKRLKISLKRAISFVRSPDPLFGLKRRRMGHAFAAALYHPQEYIILFQDDLTYYSQPKKVLKYGSVGRQPPRVQHAVAPNKMTRIGAVMNGITGHVLYKQGDMFGEVAMAALYQQIRKAYPQRKIFVIQDNAPFHHSDLVLDTAASLDVTPVFLPTYASWLNPIEKLWRWLKADLLHGHEFAHDPDLLRQQVAAFLDRFANGSSALLRYVGLLPA